MISVSEMEECSVCGDPAKFYGFNNDEIFGHLVAYLCTDDECGTISGYSLEDVKDPTGLIFTYDYIISGGEIL